MLLTGYFCIHRKMDVKSWRAVPQFLFSYFVLCLLFLLYLQYVNASIEQDLLKALLNLNHFWYVNMHFGLLLMIPFLNVAWLNLTQRQKQLMILTLFILSSFGTVTNGFFTQYWYGLYPLLYYFLGGYIRQYPVKVKLPFAFVSIILILGLQSVYTCSITQEAPFNWAMNYDGYSCCYNAVPVVIVSVLLMLIVKEVQIHSKFIAYILEQISKNSLTIYLAGCMFVTNIVRSVLMSKLHISSHTVSFFLESAITILICIVIGNLITKLYAYLASKFTR